MMGCPDDDDEFLFVFPGPWMLTMFPVIRTQQVCRISVRAAPHRRWPAGARWGGAQWAGSGEGQGEDQ